MKAPPRRPKEVFICYRREDSVSATARLHEHLSRKFSDEVFFDEDSLTLGRDFRKELDAHAEGCAIMLVVIGKRWLEKDQSGHRRIDEETDYVRREIEAALRRDIPVIPVLVEGAPTPSKDDHLPESISGLVYRQGVHIGNGQSFYSDFGLLVKRVNQDLPMSPRRVLRGLKRVARFVGWLIVYSSLIISAIALTSYLTRNLPPDKSGINIRK